MELFRPVKTPCIGVCSTGIGDQVCRGCKRFAHEVVDWNGYDEEQKGLIDSRLQGLLRQVVSNKLMILDQNRLLAAMKMQQIRFNDQQDPYCWLFALLKAGASQIDDLSEYGVKPMSAWADVPLVEMRQIIDRDYFELSCALYERSYGVATDGH